MLPLSFSGFGIREGGLILLLSPYGIPGAMAVALSFLLYLCRILVGVAGGLLEAKNVLLARGGGRT